MYSATHLEENLERPYPYMSKRPWPIWHYLPTDKASSGYWFGSRQTESKNTQLKAVIALRIQAKTSYQHGWAIVDS